MEYFLHGPVILKAKQIEKELEMGVTKPFDEVIKMNIGDAHAMGQTPITFVRQILATVTYPKLLEDPNIPEDVKSRANEIRNGCSGKSIGSYSYHSGIDLIRIRIAEYLEDRDGIPADWRNIILCSGASDGIRKIFQVFSDFTSDKKPGVLYPIPEYPIYSITVNDYNLKSLKYYLDESKNWEVNMEELKILVDESRKYCNPKVLVVVNPGNPTGQIIPKENIKKIIKFAHKENLLILADEVYQSNVYSKTIKFYPFKKVMNEMGEPYTSVPLVSFMSCSKGYMGECGIRGGYFELLNIPFEIESKIPKSLVSTLCPNVLGQVGVYCLVNPPKKGEPSYDLFNEEKDDILDKLRLKAEMATEMLNKFEGYSCNELQGAMYAFPKITFPKKAIEAARQARVPADEFYALRLLEETGICVIPGLAFGQKEGTYHFRQTILPSTDLLKKTFKLLGEFNRKFFEQYK